MAKRLLISFCYLTALVAAQTPRVSLVATQRFDAVSLGSAGGSLAALREFDLTITTPGSTAGARTWLPTTALNAMLGDPVGDGNYTRFHGWKALPTERFNFHGPFIRYSDRGGRDPRYAYFTIRDDMVNKKFLLFAGNGTATHQMRCGDYVRILPNGNLEFFITQDQIMKAAGTQGGPHIPGASALCQDGQGNLYYSPPQGSPTSSAGGHFVGGRWANDGAIAMIAAKDITYDALGNVKDVTAGSALLLLEEVGLGYNGRPSLVDLVKKAGAVDYQGLPITATANTIGIALDPRGGTFAGSFPLPGSTTQFPTVPNLLFGSDLERWAGTILSTANKGSIAVLNGREMGARTGLADGRWLGIQSDPANGRPTLMGFALLPEVTDILTLDAPHDGAILRTDTVIDLDLGYLAPGTAAYLLLAPGPFGPGRALPAYDLAPILGSGSFGWAYVVTSPLFSFPLGIAGPQGTLKFAAPRPTTPAVLGATLLFQAVRVNAGWPLISLSNPVLRQFK